MKTLTDDQAAVLLAYMESIDLHTSGIWPKIEASMIEDFGIEIPDEALSDARTALMG